MPISVFSLLTLADVRFVTHLKLSHSGLVLLCQGVSGDKLVLKVTLEFLESCVQNVSILDGSLIQDLLRV